MALVGGSMASKDIPAGLRVSFTESNISAERKKVEENKKMEVAGNNEPLYQKFSKKEKKTVILMTAMIRGQKQI